MSVCIIITLDDVRFAINDHTTSSMMVFMIMVMSSYRQSLIHTQVYACS